MNLASCLSFVGRSSDAVVLLKELLAESNDPPARALYQLSSIDPTKLEHLLTEAKASASGQPAMASAMRLHAEARFAEAIGDGEKAWLLREEAGNLLFETATDAPIDEVKLLNDAMEVTAATDWSMIPDAPVTEDDTRMIFILGLPRSGTTLVEQILAAHPEVVSAGETNLIARSILKATGRNAPSDRLTGDVLSEVLLSHPQAIRQNYLSNIQHLSLGASIPSRSNL